MDNNIFEPIEIGGNTYKIGKLNAIQQFHITRRLAPSLWALAEASGSAPSNSDPILALKPVAQAVSQLSDEDSEYVLHTCLGVVMRDQKGQWARVWAKGGGLMFDDIDLQVMMQLTFAVIRENLGNFFSALPAQSQ